MSLALSVKAAKSGALPLPRTLRDHLKERVLEFGERGRTTFLVQRAGQEPERKIVTTVQQLMIVLGSISVASEDTYGMILDHREGIAPSYIVGNTVHKFNVGRVNINAVIDEENDCNDSIIRQANTTLFMDREGTLYPALMAIFVDKLSINLSATSVLSGLDRDLLLNIAAFDMAMGQLANGRSIENGAGRSEGVVKFLSACVFSPYPKVSVQRMLEDEIIIKAGLEPAILETMGIKDRRGMPALSDDRVRTRIRMWCDLYMALKRYPSLGKLVTDQEADQMRNGIFK
ncbi:hypothetical protein HY988_06550 [Candidatus Micrarchaeota archaeon]|nr:hypothetical protein [Candidatus Micrarchaeota archaeon]